MWRTVFSALFIVAGCHLLSGCHLIYPFDHDQPGEAGPAADAGGPDLCAEPPTIKVGDCEKQCLSTASGKDTDCDGLKDPVQDRWPSCNLLMLAEELASPPWSRWEMTYAPTLENNGVPCGGGTCAPGDSCKGGATCKTQHPWRCGELRFKPGQTLTLVDAGPLFDAIYLIELRIRVDAITVGNNWSFGVTGNMTSGNAKYRRSCAIWLNKVSNNDCPSGCSKVVGMHMNHTLPQGVSTGTWSDDSQDLVGDPKGRWLLLQLWGGKDKQICRLLSGDGLKEIVSRDFPTIYKGYNFNPSAPGTIQVRASGCHTTVDYVRVFDHAI